MFRFRSITKMHLAGGLARPFFGEAQSIGDAGGGQDRRSRFRNSGRAVSRASESTSIAPTLNPQFKMTRVKQSEVPSLFR